MNKNSIKKLFNARDAPAPDNDHWAALLKMLDGALKAAEQNSQNSVNPFALQLQRYETIFEKVAQGVCLFDGDERLILSNQRYAEIYRLPPEKIQPGMSLRQIAELRFAINTNPDMSLKDYLTHCDQTNSSEVPKTWQAKLMDGRTIHVSHQRLPDGGWVATHEDITARLNESLTVQALIDVVPDYLWVKDVNSSFVVVNKSLAKDCGRETTANMLGLSDFDITARDIAEIFFADEQDILKTGRSTIDQEELFSTEKNIAKWLSTTKVPLRGINGEIFGLVGISRDITERKKADELRGEQAHILELIAMNAPLKEVLDCLIHLAQSQIAGITGSFLLLDKDGQHLRHGSAPNMPEAYCHAIDGVQIGPNVGSCGTAAYRRKPVIVSDIASDPLWADYKDLAAKFGFRSCWSTPVLSHEGSVLGTFALYSPDVREPTSEELRLIDISTRIAAIKLTEDRVQFMATHDALTGLPNRTMLKDRLTQAIFRAKRDDHWVTTLFIDLDNFKTINDSLGHNAGDELLKTVAGRMVNCVRSTDTAVRLGGDEFVIVLQDQPKDNNIIAQILQKIRTAIAEPLQLEGQVLKVTCSIGSANYPDDASDLEVLLANADAAMYRAKEIGRDNFQFYTPELNSGVQGEFRMQEELRNALARSQLSLSYQPQVDLRTGRVFAVEALLRWNHPTQGVISPAVFIPIAEESGTIVSIGEWVLKTACLQNKAWQNAGLPPINVSVNVCARQFKEKNWVNQVASALKESGLEAKYLELELTESLIMQDAELAVRMMKELEVLGVRIALDDFGTGYSILSALKNFPVARLKIDKSFVDEISNNENDPTIASAVMMLGQKLNMRVIAEGVETDAQIKFLREHGCDEMQGYHFSRPISAEAIEQMLRTPGTA